MLKYKKPLVLAYYLPQFHSIPENDIWWGAGFTEWTSLYNSREFIKSQNIRFPVEVDGAYELPSKEVMEWQSSIAKSNNVNGFFLWDYWFGGGKKLLNKPKEYLLENDVDFPYALIWANHSWFDKSRNKLLIEQRYLGEDDYILYFRDCLKHFKSDNYIKIEGKPVFGIFMPHGIPDLDVFKGIFEKLAISEGFAGIFWVAENTKKKTHQFEWRVNSTKFFSKRKFLHPLEFVREQLIKRYNFNSLGPVKYSYKKLVSENTSFEDGEVPVVFTGWDTTPRHGKRGTILFDFTLDNFMEHAQKTLEQAKVNHSPIVIVKSWNEWAEGNLFEPDTVFGNKLLEGFGNLYLKTFSDD